MSPISRLSHPRSFFHIVSLRTATEFIIFTLALNKITGLYGFLALFTGYELNPVQLSHYVYSLVVLAAVTYLHPFIRQKDEVLRIMALAWLYVLDTVINSVYTALFGTGWFILLAQHLNDSIGSKIPGQEMMDNTSGFTNPEFNVSKVEVIASPKSGVIPPGQDAHTLGFGGSSADLGNAVFQSGSLASITVIGFLWSIRIYFCVVIMSYARSVLRQYVASTSTATYSEPEDSTMAENPFRPGREDGVGISGKIGRALVRLPTKRYWLGKDDSEEWVRTTSGRFESGRQSLHLDTGVGERERRARSGTGPPLPSPKKTEG